MLFQTVIQELYGKEVLKFDHKNESNQRVLDKLDRAMISVLHEIQENPIVRPRPNEVGNDMEEPVIAALNKVNLQARAPEAKSGKGKSTGYPDIIANTEIGDIFLEVKTYNKRNETTTFRSFYLSPSTDPKVHTDACHLLLGFEMENSGNEYRPVSFKIVDLYGLECSLKSEYNSDNRRLYERRRILKTGNLDRQID